VLPSGRPPEVVDHGLAVVEIEEDEFLSRLQEGVVDHSQGEGGQGVDVEPTFFPGVSDIGNQPRCP